ncbi:Uncharacterised protein [Bordetella pertussis]|nr:Uncharacterised protein [Bordetella pertussis]
MLVQTSVVTRCAPWQACIGSLNCLSTPAAGAPMRAGSSS